MKQGRRLADQCRSALSRFPAVKGLVDHARLWKWRRRAVARGAALGVACALLIPVGQIPVSAIGAAVIRANVPVAVSSTFITNPVTTLPIYYGAHRIGSWILGAAETAASPPMLDQVVQGGSSILVGILTLAVTGAITSYVVVNAVWIQWLLKRKAALFAAVSRGRKSCA